MIEPKRCSAYDQISDRTCRYDADHGGRHNFARLDHDCTLERELRRALDEMTKALAEALDLFNATWCPEHGMPRSTRSSLAPRSCGIWCARER